ncbi:MAG: hypothetical protein ACT4OX_15525 [Actinomycetota bacterium]
MPTRRLLAPVVVTAAVAGGGFAGALLGVPGLAEAQEETTTTTTDDNPERRPFAGRRGPGPGLEAAAEALGIELDALHDALRDGQTIAEVAAEQGVEVDTVIDAMVAAIVENTDRPEEEVRERVTRLVNDGRPEGGRGGGGPGEHGPGGVRGRGPGFDAAAEALGIEVDALHQALRDGQTIAEVAAEQGVDLDTVIDAMVAEARERITEFVNEGPQRRAANAAGADEVEASTDASAF